MTTQAEFFPERDLTDRIADALPEDVRADYFREMSHLRLLPENDEMLRILRAMQFLALLIEQAPSDVAYEREQLGELLTASLKTMQQTHRATVAYQKELEQRITRLPAEIVKGISPEAIAAKINESLRQQFAQSGLSETAQALEVIAREIKNSTASFQKTTLDLTGTYRGVAAQASAAMSSMQDRISGVTSTATEAIRELKASFLREYKWSVAMLTTAGISVGFVMGLFFERGRQDPTPDPAPTAPVVQTLPPARPAAPVAVTPKTAHKKHVPTQAAPQEPATP